MIIGLCGLIGCGKTTAARHLIDTHGFWRHRFAGPLKGMMRALGLTDDEIDGPLKEMPCPLLGGKTPRYAMQTIGTEWGRNLIDSDLWTRAWSRQVSQSTNRLAVADDVRFKNEADIIRDMGGTIIKIERPGLVAGSHISEAIPFEPDFVMDNDADIKHLQDQLDWWLERKAA